MRVKKFKKELLARSEKLLKTIKKNTSTRFQCSYCASNYAKKATLNAHVKKKHEENWKLEASSKRSANKFQCPYCANKYSQKHNMKTHVKKKHEENVITKDDGKVLIFLEGQKI